jgi:hypothetical protein
MGFGPALPHACLGPPSWFLTTLTGCSSGSFAGLLHPAADHGVHRVAAPPCHLPVVGRRAFPTVPHPPELSPLAQQARRHRRTLPPRRQPGCEPCSTSRPCSTRESVALPPRCRGAAPVALMGFPFLEPRACRLVAAGTEVPRYAPEGASGRPSLRASSPPRRRRRLRRALRAPRASRPASRPPSAGWLARQTPAGVSSPAPRGGRSGLAGTLGHRTSAGCSSRVAPRGSARDARATRPTEVGTASPRGSADRAGPSGRLAAAATARTS